MSRQIADVTFRGINGLPMAGAFAVQFSLAFRGPGWPAASETPQVRLDRAPVRLTEPAGLLIGHAVPQFTSPYRVTQSPLDVTCIYALELSPLAMERVEAARSGGDMAFEIEVPAVVIGRDGPQVWTERVPVRCPQSEWLRVLRECRFGRTLLFEIPMFSSDGESDDGAPARELEQARRHMLLGHFQEAVATCRRAIEALNRALGQVELSEQAKKQYVKSPREMSVFERELLLRVTAMNFAHLAHHADGTAERQFDRADAILLLGITSALVQAAYARSRTAP